MPVFPGLAGTEAIDGIIGKTKAKVGDFVLSLPSGRRIVVEAKNAARIQLGGKGGLVGPALDDVGARLEKDFLEQWLRDPLGVKPGTTMPKLGLTEEQRNEVVIFLSKQREAGL